MNVLNKMVIIPEKEYILIKTRNKISEVKEEKPKEIPTEEEEKYKKQIVNEIAKFEKEQQKKKEKKKTQKPQKKPRQEIKTPEAWRSLQWTNVKSF